MLRIFIGFDPRETVAYHAMVQSILENTSVPVALTPLALAHLGGALERVRDPLQSTDFAFSRFLVPSLCGFEGWALFMDCDMIVLEDLAALFELCDDNYAVQVVKHDHRPPETKKFLAQKQTRYQKKNWSSVMLFNNAKCRALSSAYVNSATGLDLHQFKWLENETEIGALPARWNHLVGYSDAIEDPAVLHFTTGGPWYDDYRNCDYSNVWRKYWALAQRVIEKHKNASSEVAEVP
ncbi:MAG: glycosyltransferase [Pseudomonadota bacterium]